MLDIPPNGWYNVITKKIRNQTNQGGSEMKNTFKKAHEMAREMKAKYPEIDYKVQFGLFVSYLLENKEGKEMTKEDWYNGLTEEEKNKVHVAQEDAIGYDLFKNSKVPSEERKEIIRENVLENRYKRCLQEEKSRKEKELRDQEIAREEEMQYQRDLSKGIVTIELYESNKYKCWAAEITGTDKKYGLKREFINPTEIRGNDRIYEFEEGKYYNYVYDNEQYFAKVVSSKLVNITKSEIKEIMK